MIHVGNRRIVARPQLLDVALIRGCRLGMVAVAVALPADAVVPVAAPRLGQRLIFVQIQVVFRGIQRRVRPHKAGHQKERLRAVTAAQEIPALAGDPVGRMVLFLVDPGAHDPAVAVKAGVHGVGIHAKLLFEPPIIIIGHALVLITGRGGAAVGMEIAVMQSHIVKAQVVAQRMDVHFADALGIVARLAQFPGQRVGVLPRDQIFVANAARVLLGHAGIQRGAGGNAGRAGGIGVFIAHTLGGQGIQKRRFHIRMPGNTQAVAAHLVCHKQDNIGTFIHNKPLIIVFAGKGVPHKHGTPLSVLQIIPLDLVRVHVQVEAAAIAGINGGILRLVGVVYHAILAVLDVGMYFDIVVRAEPLVQVGLIVGSPQDGSVQHAVVHKAVRETTDINTTTLAVLVRGHLDFLVTLNQNFCALQRKNALFALTKVNVMVGAVGQNKVVAVLVPVVLIVVQGKAGFLLHAERCG